MRVKELLSKKSFKKKANMLLSSVIAINLVSSAIYNLFYVDVGAEGVPDSLRIDREGRPMMYIEDTKGENFGTYLKKTDNGEYVFCLEHVKPAPENIVYNRGSLISDVGMKHIVLSEPNMGSFEEDYYVKQVALNYYQGDVDFIKGQLVSGQKYRDKAIEIGEKAKKVAAGTADSEYIVEDTISVSPNKQSFKIEGEYYVTDWFNVTHVGNLKNYTISLNNAPNGTQIINQDGEVATSFSKSDKKFKLRVHRNNIDKKYLNISVDISATYKTNQPVRYIPTDDTYQVVLLMDDSVVSKSVKTTVTSSLDPRGAVRLSKVSENNDKLLGASFDLVKDGTVIKNKVTDSNGEIYFDNLELGRYQIVEKTAPIGHVLNTTPKDVDVLAGRESLVTFDNEIIKGKISVNKKDLEIDSLNLQGVEFEIYDRANNVVDKLVTDENGYAESKLLNYGTYSMKEVKSLDGYHVNNSLYTIQIDEHNKNYNHQISNEIYKGKIHLVKVDSENEEVPVEGAKFDIIAENVRGINKGEVVESLTTDKDGFAITKDLRYGTYKIRETYTPNPYWQSDKDYFIDVLENNKTYVRYIKNEPIKSKIRVVKTDAEDNSLLDGVRFNIVNTDLNKVIVFKEYVGGNVLDKTEFTTDSNGEFITPQELPYGNYELVEIESKEGYLLNGPIPFSINRNTSIEDIDGIGKVAVIEVENDRIEGSLELLKVDTYTNNPLANIEFEIEALDGFMKGTKFREVTNEEGKIVLNNLEYGKYKLTEINTLEDYCILEEATEFSIVEHGQVVKLEFENKPKEGYLEIKKVDSVNGRELEGAEFKILNENMEEVQTIVTDKDGVAKSDLLRYGNYILVESSSPKNYIDNKGEFTFTIAEEGQVIEKVIENDVLKGDVEISKIDSETKELLEGALMQINGISETNDYIEIEFVSSNEVRTFNLPVGKYELRELDSPEEYEQSDEVVSFEIKDGEEVVEVKFDNVKKPVIKPEVDETPTTPETEKPNTQKPSTQKPSTQKPSTGDFIAKSYVLTIVSSILLIIINKDSIINFVKRK